MALRLAFQQFNGAIDIAIYLVVSLLNRTARLPF